MTWGKLFVFLKTGLLLWLLLAVTFGCKNPSSESNGGAESIQEIRAMGGEVVVTLGKVVRINLSSKPVTDVDLETLGQFTDLQSLSLADTTITDDGLRHLALFKRLRELTLSGCPNISGAGLKHLQALRSLYKLQLSGNRQLDNEAIRALWPMRSLGKLDIYQTGVDDDGYNELVRRLPALKGNITH